MSSYQKFTLSTFKKKLENGDYENATGANRAVGKTQELSEKEKAKAKAMVVDHFGSEPTKPKPAKKAPKAKKVAKKASKKSTKAKVSKKAPAKKAKKAAVKQAPAAKPAKKAVKRGKKKASKRGTAVAAPVTEPDPAVLPVAAQAKPVRALRRVAAVVQALAPTATKDVKRAETIQLMGQVITQVDTILRSMELSKKLFPKGEIERGVKSAQNIMNRAVSELERAVVPEAGEPELQSPPAAVAKASNRKGKRATKPTTAPAETPAVAAEAPISGDGEGAVDLNDPSLSEADRAEIQQSRKVRASTTRRFGAAPVTAS